MPEEGMTPSLEKCNGVTGLFVDLDLCEKYSVDPLEFFGLKISPWQTDRGRKLKTIMFAKRQLQAEEEARRLAEIEKKHNRDDKDKPKRGRG